MRELEWQLLIKSFSIAVGSIRLILRSPTINTWSDWEVDDKSSFNFKSWHWANVLSNMKKSENGLSNFSGSYRVGLLQFPELIQFWFPNPLIFFNILRTITPHVTSPWETVFFESNFRTRSLVYKSWLSSLSNSLQQYMGFHRLSLRWCCANFVHILFCFLDCSCSFFLSYMLL